jgi:Xaa-Pro dipeptidase
MGAWVIEGLPKRFERIFQSMDEEVDAVLIANRDRIDPNFFYLTGYTSGLFERSYAVLHRDLGVEVLTSPLEADIAKRGPHRVLVQRGYGAAELKRSLHELLGDVEKVGVNFRSITHSDYVALEKMLAHKKLVDASEAFAKARLIKDADEVEALSTAARITSQAVDRVPDLVKEGMTEKELQAEIEYLFTKKGADGLAFSSIVAFGENSALPHYFSGERRLRKGDAVLTDVGAKYKLYCADLTRTFFFGRVSAEQEEMYNTVLEAQQAALKLVRDGAQAKRVHLAAQSLIDSTKFKGKFIHGLGHSLGIEVHDGEGMGRRSRHRLRENMVVTVEPGVYVPGLGGVRIEDDVVVTRNSYGCLTTSKKELVVI